MKKVYKDYLPLNANVTIDYSAEEKDRVRFDYPIKYSYKKAVWKGAYVAILGLWLYILLAIAYSGLIIYVLYKCILLIGTAQSVPIHISLASLITALLPLIIFGYVMFGIPAIITYYLSLDKKRLAKFVPKLSKYSTLIMGNIIERKFITKDIKDNKATILRFSNVYMDYNATGDFNKQLQRVEIKNLPHERRYRILYIYLIRIKRMKLKKTAHNFSATFYFKKRPKDGSLIVKYI